ncbi:MAG: hypothetical protein LBI19_04865 [Oscillospiraceae bacterium]|nr:hypothetical protein [Oscillospiraceae bacterium]
MKCQTVYSEDEYKESNHLCTQDDCGGLIVRVDGNGNVYMDDANGERQ